MSSQGVMSSTEVNKNPGLYPLKDSSLVLAVRLGPEINFRACLLSTGKIPPHFHTLVANPAKNLFSRFLSRDPQRRFRSKKPGEQFPPLWAHRQFHFRLPQNVRVPETVLGGNAFQRLLALLYLWGRCFGSLKTFQSCLTVRTNTNVSLCSGIHLNFISTGQDSIHLAWITVAHFPRVT